jgi:hypothetical protein
MEEDPEKTVPREFGIFERFPDCRHQFLSVRGSPESGTKRQPQELPVDKDGQPI